jgi:hypothetical protein
MAPYEHILRLAGYVPHTFAFRSARVHPYRKLTKGGTFMTTQPIVSQHRSWVWTFRIGLFAFGVLILALWFTNDLLGLFGPIQGGTLILLSLLVSTAVRNPIGWSFLSFSAIGAALIFLVSLGVMFRLAPDQDTLLGGIGFMISLFGFLGFYTSAIATLVVTLRVYAQEWRERHGGTAAPPPTTSR